MMGDAREAEERTLCRPGHLLLCVDFGHRRCDLEPYCAAAVPGLDISSCGYFGEVVLRWARVVDLLAANIVDRGAGWDRCDAGCVGGLVASDVARGRVFDAGLGVCVFGAAGGGPVCGVGLSVDDEAGEGV